MPSCPTVLLTNLFVISRTGSELHTLELARAFAKRGWDVSVYALVVGYPLRHAFDEHGIKLIEFGCEERLADEYDLLIAQHHIVADYLWVNTDIVFKKIVVSVLGLGGMEGLPRVADSSGMIVAISEETKEHLFAQNEVHIGEREVIVFPNYATSDFFACSKPHGGGPLREMAVISNHIPDELMQLQYEADDINVSYVGYEFGSEEITPAFLQKFDVVITIGRTVQACLAAKVPCYCYDHFGGPGYLNPSDIDIHAWHNFSGRSSSKKLTGEELLEDIRNGYDDAVRNLSSLQEIAFARWSFDELFEAFYDAVDALPEEGAHAEERSFPEGVKIQSAALCAFYQKELLEKTGVAQAFWGDEEADICEEASTRIRYEFGTWVDLSLFAIPSNKKILRLDPDDFPCRVLLREAAQIDQRDIGAREWFTEDPQIRLDCPADEADRVQFMAFRISPAQVVEHFKSQLVVQSDEMERLQKRPRLMRWLKGSTS